MTKHWILGIALWGVVAGCATTPPPAASPSSQAPAIAAQLQGPAPDSGLMSILKGQPDPDPKQRAAALAAKIGLKGDVTEDHGSAFVIDGSSTVSVDETTGIASYNTPYKWGGLDHANAPDLETCKADAQAFLTKLDVAPQDQYGFYQDGTSSAGTSDGQSWTPERQVIYNRRWGGRLIQGPGSQLMVFVGPNGRINGANIDWVQLTEVKQVPYKSADEAQKGLTEAIVKEDKILITNHPESPADFKVTQTTLGYTAFMNPDGSRTILPAYAYAGTYPDNPGATRIYFVAANDDYPLPDPGTTGLATPAPVGSSPPPLMTPPPTH